MSRPDPFHHVHSEGALLPGDLLARLAAGERGLDGLTPEAYHLAPGERLNEATNRAWNRLTGAWATFRAAVEALGPEDPATRITRERWLLVLFQELGYGRLLAAKPLDIEGKSYPVSHMWGATPVHLVGWNVDLDRRTRGVAGAASASPHSMVQELLNRSEAHLWAFVSNGRTLRILRDNVQMSRQAYVEFDLQGLMDGEAWSDFQLLWLLCHESRVQAAPRDERGSTGPEECWLERWSRLAQEDGKRALDGLRVQVEKAITALGQGFLAHPANEDLRGRLRSGALDRQEYYRQVLRLVYRLLFLLVAESRDLLLDPKAPEEARQRYLAHYSLLRLRDVAERRRGTRHPDLWRTLRLVMQALGRDEGCPGLALPALGSFLWSELACPDLEGCDLANQHLLETARALAWRADGGGVRPINYRIMGTEELGSVYEGLLELHPELNTGAATFELKTAAGHERKTTGSYYTPPELVQSLLDTALEPVVAERLQAARKAHRVAARSDAPSSMGADGATLAKALEAALLDLKVCDPACGSGHFLIAAAHRLARHLAAVRTGEDEPPPEARRHAMRDVIGRCIYGVDLNPMAVELCKVALWIEAMEPGRPLTFLENRIVCGNSLLGTTPALMAGGIPDEAFEPLEGDDRKVASAFKKRNRQERKGGQQSLWYGESGSGNLAEYGQRLREGVLALEALDDGSLDGIRAKEEAWRRLQESEDYRNSRLAADAWCAAFAWPKSVDCVPPPTQDVFERLQRNPDEVSPAIVDEVRALAARFRYLHWHVAFSGVFDVMPSEALGEIVRRREEHSEDPHHAPEPAEPGWSGGFAIVLGNPPWERIKIQEKEWFAERVPEVAAAPQAAERTRRIEALRTSNPPIHAAFMADLRQAEGESHLLRNSGRYPLCGRGDINTYAVFAEAATDVISPQGAMGMIIPPGIATDSTTQHFFGHLVRAARLHCVYTFENEDHLFPGVDHRVNFTALTVAGSARPSREMDFVWFARRAEDLRDPDRHYRLSPDDIQRLNPNTGTCPIFRSHRDAEINRAIYSRVPVLLREGPPEENPWSLSFQRMLDMANDSGLFRTREQLESEGWRPNGNRFQKGDAEYLPLYEAKMLHNFDHRLGTYQGQTEAQANMGTLPRLTDAQHAAPDFLPLPRYWVPATEVDQRLDGRWDRGWLLGWRDICRSTDERTVIASLLPRVAVGHTTPLMFSPEEPQNVACLYASLCTFVFDYIARQKIGGTHLTYSYLKQLPVLPPAAYDAPCPWSPGQTVGQWILPRVLELTYTSHDLAPFARDCGHEGPPFRWDPDRRFHLRCELDAAYFHLYGVNREDAEYILDTFPVTRKNEERQFGEYRTARTVMQEYDRIGSYAACPSTR